MEVFLQWGCFGFLRNIPRAVACILQLKKDRIKRKKQRNIYIEKLTLRILREGKNCSLNILFKRSSKRWKIFFSCTYTPQYNVTSAFLSKIVRLHFYLGDRNNAESVPGRKKKRSWEYIFTKILARMILRAVECF